MHSCTYLPCSLWLIESSDTGEYDEYQEQLAELNAEEFQDDEEEEPEEEEDEMHERFRSSIIERFEEQNEANFALQVKFLRYPLVAVYFKGCSVYTILWLQCILRDVLYTRIGPTIM